jgi:hypothetical protein
MTQRDNAMIQKTLYVTKEQFRTIQRIAKRDRKSRS